MGTDRAGIRTPVDPGPHHGGPHADWRHVSHLPIPGATKRHVPVESAEQVAGAYQQQIISPAEYSPREQ
ncbi:hypothetical protein [Nocardia pseudovaccinii]|uniref:hypothetical protein n=1 Tax=Nocardia pseudovaccinii TaxID=189540 RepID=UPI0007A3C6BB|nr:hypothetical protein [Nocardia pseudovaccinii]